MAMTSTTPPSSQVKASSLRLLVLSPSTSSNFSGSASASPSTSIPTAPLFPAFLEAITGSKPSADVTTFAGYTSHPPLRLTTKYYARDVGIWCDELPSPPPPPPSTRASPAQVSSSAGERDSSTVHESNAESERLSRSTYGPKADANTDRATETDTDTDTGTESRPLEPDPEPEPTLKDWTSQILSPEAREVRAVIAGIVLLLPTTASPSQSQSQDKDRDQEAIIQFIRTAHTLREAIEDDLPGRDIASLVILQSSSPSPSAAAARRRDVLDHDHLVEQLEERCLAEGYLGWEFVAWDGVRMATASGSGDVAFASGSGSGSGSVSDQTQAAKGHDKEEQEQEEVERNEFGEKTGLPRVLEVLEAIDWSADRDLDEAEGEAFDFDFNNDDDDDEGNRGGLPNIRPARDGSGRFTGLDFELQREMMELKMSMLGWGDDEDDEDNGEAGSRETNHGDGDDDDVDVDEESQIERLPGLVERVVAIREAGQEMGQDERERFAKREIARIMREMG